MEGASGGNLALRASVGPGIRSVRQCGPNGFSSMGQQARQLDGRSGKKGKKKKKDPCARRLVSPCAKKVRGKTPHQRVLSGRRLPHAKFHENRSPLKRQTKVKGGTYIDVKDWARHGSGPNLRV